MRTTVLILMVLGLALAGCGKDLPPPAKETDELVKKQSARKEVEVKEITVQHILIGVKQYGTKGALDADEARALADEVLQAAINGDDFDSLVKEHTTDPGPSTYRLTNDEAVAKDDDVFYRYEMVPAFGNVGWRLEVGEIGIALYHSESSPYGFHIIKRLK